MLSEAVRLLENAGAGNGADCVFNGGKAAFLAEATWGGGSAKLQVKLPNGSYADVSSVTLSANGMVITELPMGIYRAVTATATAAYVRLVRIPY